MNIHQLKMIVDLEGLLLNCYQTGQLPDKKKFVILEKELSPIEKDCREGRFMNHHTKRKLLDNKKQVISKNASFPIVQDCRLGRYLNRFSIHNHTF